MTTALLERTAAVRIERRAKKALSSPPYPTAKVIEFRDATGDHDFVISPGTVFVKEGTPVPKSVGFRLNRFGYWNLLADLGSFQTANRLGERGWYLSCIVPAVRALGFAFNSQAAVRKALHHLMQKGWCRHRLICTANLELPLTCALTAPRYLLNILSEESSTRPSRLNVNGASNLSSGRFESKFWKVGINEDLDGQIQLMPIRPKTIRDDPSLSITPASPAHFASVS